MNKEEIDLLRYDLIIEYYKNKDITTKYRRITDNTAIDNEILDNLKDTLFITTLNKYNKLQQENKQLKDNWNKLKEILSKGIIDNSSGEIDQEMWLSSELLEIMQELESGDNNEK